MGKQSKWAISKALKDAGLSVEIRADAREFMDLKRNDRTLELSHSDDAAIDLALAILDGELNEIPSEVDLKWALRVLRGKAVLESERVRADEKLHTNATANAILEFMDGIARVNSPAPPSSIDQPLRLRSSRNGRSLRSPTSKMEDGMLAEYAVSALAGITDHSGARITPWTPSRCVHMSTISECPKKNPHEN